MAKTFPGYAWRSYDEQFRQSRALTKWPCMGLRKSRVIYAYGFGSLFDNSPYDVKLALSPSIQHSRFDSRATYRQPSRFYVNSQQRNSFGSKVDESSRYYLANREGQLDKGDNAGQRAQATNNADRLQ